MQVEFRPLPAPFGWVGGKKQLRHRIAKMLPPHRVYVEPFTGAASVFWHKEPSEVEVLNDLDPDVARFYQLLTGCDVVADAKDWNHLARCPWITTALSPHSGSTVLVSWRTVWT